MRWRPIFFDARLRHSSRGPPLYHFRKCSDVHNVCSGSLADILAVTRDVRYSPKSEHRQATVGCPLSAINGREQPQQKWSYSITSSANNCIDRDTWTPSARPHMVTNSNLVGCSMGMSVVLAPRRSLTSCRAAMSPRADVHARPRVEIQGCSADNGGAAPKRGRCADQGDRDQSTLMFAARMTLAHFSVVSARSLA